MMQTTRLNKAAILLIAALLCCFAALAPGKAYANTNTMSQFADEYDALVSSSRYPQWNNALVGTGSKAIVPGVGITNVDGDDCVYMVPQGVCNAGRYLLITAVDEGEDCDKTHEQHDSVMYVMDASSGEYLTTIVLGGNKSHVGGVASDGSYVYIADSSHICVWKFPLSVVAREVARKQDSCLITLAEESLKIESPIKPSYVTYFNGMVIAGHYSEVLSENVIVGLDPEAESDNVILPETQVAIKSQGVAFAAYQGKTYMFCSSSVGRTNDSKMYVYKAVFDGQSNLTLTQCGSPITCPNMMEDIDVSGGTLIAVHESAARKYRDGDGKGNSDDPIDRVIQLDVGRLLEAVGAVDNADYIVDESDAVSGEVSTDDPEAYRTIESRYPTGGSKTTGFEWRDAMLLQSSTSLSTDLAKASVALASTSYSKSLINTTLTSMGFAPVGDGQFNYDRVETLEDNDFVGYSVYRKIVSYEGQTYALYCVPIRGTHGEADWYSNFNLGITGDHAGFYTSAQQILRTLESALTSDGFDSDHTVLWTTGHSRGAAVANIVAGKFSATQRYANLVDTDHVFGYTYACPSVSKNLGWEETTLTNIYNFNNPGDMIPLLPRSSWGYKRYGQTIELTLDDGEDPADKAIFDNMTEAFKSVYGAEWASLESGREYLDVMDSICVNEEDFFSADNKLIFSLACYALDNQGGGTRYSFIEWLNYVACEEKGWLIQKLVVSRFPGLSALRDYINNVLGNANELVVFVQSGIVTTAGMSDEEFSRWLDENRSKINTIENEYKLNIDTRAELIAAVAVMNRKTAGAVQLVEASYYAAQLLKEAEDGTMTAITHGHTTETYVTWINSQYFGYKGWQWYTGDDEIIMDSAIKTVGYQCFYHMASPSVISLSQNIRRVAEYGFADRELELSSLYSLSLDSVGAGAFAQSTGLSKVILRESVAEILGGTFSYCQFDSVEIRSSGVALKANSFTGSQIKKITMPCDAVVAGNPPGTSRYDTDTRTFLNANIESIRFTPGATGECYSYRWYSGFSPLAEVLKSVSFDEGITHIGDHYLEGMTSLESVTLPSTLVSVGEYAFASCENVTSFALPISFVSAKEAAFKGCKAASFVIPSPLEELGVYAFSGCENLSIMVVISELITEIPAHVFEGCTGKPSFEIRGAGTIVTARCFADSVIDTIIAPGDTCSHVRDGDGGAFVNSTAEELHITYGEDGYMADFNRESQTYKDDKLRRVNLEGNLWGYALKGVKRLILDEGIVSVGGYAFAGFDSLESATLPSTLKYIERYAFSGCRIPSLQIPSGVISIGTRAFSDLVLDSELVIPEGVGYTGVSALAGAKIPRVVFEADSLCFDNKALEGAEIGTLSIPLNNGEDLFLSRGSYDYVFPLRKAKIDTIILRATEIDDSLPRRYCPFNARSESTEHYIGQIIVEEGVTSLPEKYFYCASMESVSLPSTLQNIGEKCFEYCEELSEVVFRSSSASPSALQSIGENAFRGCSSLTTVAIPESVESIGSGAFSETALASIVIPAHASELEGNVFAGAPLESISVDSANTMFWTDGRSLVSNDGVLYQYAGNSGSSYTIPQGVTEIGDGAFSDSQVTSVVIPNGVTAIGLYAFCCSALEQISLSNTVATVGDYAFSGTSLESVDLPEGVISLGEGCFRECEKLTEIALPSTLRTIGFDAFRESYIEKVNISDVASYVQIGYSVAKDSVYGVTYSEDSVPTWNSASMYLNGQLLKELMIPQEVTAIGDYAFYRCNNLVRVESNYALSSVGNHAFDGCTSLQQVVFQEQVNVFGEASFGGCRALKHVQFSGPVESFGSYAFCGSGMLEVLFPDSVGDLGESAFSGCSMKSVSFGGAVGSFGSYAFSYCDSLKSVELPEGTLSVGEGAFRYCESLESVSLPASVSSIGSCVFCDCPALAFFSIDEGNQSYWTDGISIISSEGKLVAQFAPNVVSYQVPEGVTTLGAYAFSSNNTLKCVFLPSTLAFIEEGAFYVCPALTTIYAPATMQLQQVGECPFYDCYSLVGGNGTAFDGGNYEYARIDTADAPGYFTLMCAHPEEGRVAVEAVEPTCTMQGRTAGIQCSECQMMLSGGETVEPLGHLYEDGACSRCGKIDPEVAWRSVLNLTGVTAEFESEGVFPWVVENDCLVTTNQGVDNSESVCQITLTCDGAFYLSIECDVESQENCDFLVVFVDGEEVSRSSGNTGWGYGSNMEEGTHVITLNYVKDGEGFAYDDRACLEEIKAISYCYPHVPVASDNGVEPTCERPGRSNEVHCGNCNKVLEESELLDPLGHNYVDGFCQRCGVQEGIDAREAFLNLDGSTTSVEYGGDYPWVMEDDKLVAFDSGIDGTTSEFTVKFTVPVYSELGYACSKYGWVSANELTLYLDGEVMCQLGEYSGTSSFEYVEAGSHELRVVYQCVESIRPGITLADVEYLIIQYLEEVCEHVNTCNLNGYEPTCSTPGRTAGEMCDDCGRILEGYEEIAPLGHLFEDGKCTRCGMMPGDPARAEIITTSGVEVSVEDVDYPWTLTDDGLKSSNYEQDGTSSTTVLRFVGSEDFFISFDWAVSSEKNYDNLCIAIDGDEEVCASGEQSGRVHYLAESGAHTVELSYSKDRSEGSGSDCAWVSNIKAMTLCDVHTPVFAAAVEPTCTMPGNTEGQICSVCGLPLEGYEVVEALGHQFEHEICTTCGQRCDDSGDYPDEWNISGSCQWAINDHGTLFVGPVWSGDDDDDDDDDDESDLESLEDDDDVVTGVLEITRDAEGNVVWPWAGSEQDIVEVRVEDGVQASTCEDMFANCTWLYRADLSGLCLTESVLGTGLFENCETLIWANLPSYLGSIEEDTFAGCTNLQTVSVPFTVTSIADTAFAAASDVCFYCDEDSYAFEYAAAHDIEVLKSQWDLEAISLSAWNVTLGVGAECQLIATLVPGGDYVISWSSNNEDVATVSQDGLITIVGSGKALIFAEVGDIFAVCSVEGLLMGDVNNNGVVNIVDAQLAYDLGCHRDVPGLDDKYFLRADVAGTDGEVDAVDAFAIANYVLRGSWVVLS